jgi:hypothetical protein
MSNVCNSAYRIGTYASSYVINPCNPAGSIGTYDDPGSCGCCNGIEEECGYFTGTTGTINPGNIFSGGAFIAGIFELFLETVNQVSSNPVSAGDPQYKGAYYYYYINSNVSKLNVITAQGGLNTSSLIQAVDTTQINFTTGVGIILNLNIPCYVGWKFTRSK